MPSTPQAKDSDPLDNAAGLLSDFPGGLVRGTPSFQDCLPVQGQLRLGSPTHGRMAASLPSERQCCKYGLLSSYGFGEAPWNPEFRTKAPKSRKEGGERA
jgi:hypothetical protein